MPSLMRIAAAIVVATLAGAAPVRAEDPVPSAPAAAIAGAARPHHVYLVGTLLVSRPWIDVDASGEDQPGYLVIENRGGSNDRLTAVSIPGAEIELAGADGAPTPALVVPAGGRLVLAPGGPHFIMHGVQTTPERGAPIEGTLRFARAGSLPVSFSTDRQETEEDDQTAPTTLDKPAQLQQ